MTFPFEGNAETPLDDTNQWDLAATIYDEDEFEDADEDD